MLLKGSSQRTVKRTHEPTGVIVEFIKVGHLQRTRIIADAQNRIGEILEELAQAGVGVHGWEGVEREMDLAGNNPVVKVEYSTEALDQVVEACTEFGGWFNDALLSVNGMFNSEEAKGEDDEGKSEPPKTG